jgi:hypothetical protein
LLKSGPPTAVIRTVSVVPVGTTPVEGPRSAHTAGRPSGVVPSVTESGAPSTSRVWFTVRVARRVDVPAMAGPSYTS